MTPPDWGTAVISIASIMFTLRFFTIFFSIDRDRQPPPYGPTPGHGYDPFSPFNPNPPGLPRPGMKLLRLFFSIHDLISRCTKGRPGRGGGWPGPNPFNPHPSFPGGPRYM